MRERINAGCTPNGPLGMTTGDISDSQITSSSTYPTDWDTGCHERFGRLYQPNGLAWCAKYKSSSEWLQVDLGVPTKVFYTHFKPNTHRRRRRNSTVELSFVGGVYGIRN